MDRDHETQIMSKYETLKRHEKRTVGGHLAEKIRKKGWSVRDAADYLGVSRQRLYSVFADPSRARIWECAIEGLPHCSKAIHEELKDAREKRQQARTPRDGQRSKPKNPSTELALTLGIEVNDVVIALTYAGIAEEGEEGWIASIRRNATGPELLVCMQNGEEDWFPLDTFNEHFITNGKTHTE